MRGLVIAGLVIAGIVALNELRFLGRTTLAVVILGITGTLILYGIVLLDLVESKK